MNASGRNDVTTGRRGLVLGGGGMTGIAWEIGLLAGLAEAGLDLAQADLVIGTSAGSVVGAQLLSGVPMERFYEEQLRDAAGERNASIGLGLILRLVVASIGDPVRGRARLGRAALAARTESPEAWRARFEQLDGRDWPDTRLLITAVDAESGEAHVFERGRGVSLIDAVCASCAVPLVFPPVAIGGRRYIDGGMRSVTNADLATGCDRVLALAPVTAAFRRVHRVDRQLASLGPTVRSLAISPHRAARRAIGANVLDPSRRAAAARAGRAQAAVVAGAVAALWSPAGQAQTAGQP